MNKSIRYYFFTSIAAVMIVSLLTFGIIQSLLAVNYFSSQKKKQLEQVVSSIADGVHSGNLQVNEQTIAIARSMAQIADATLIIANLQGEVVYADEIPGLDYETPVAGYTLDEISAAGVFSAKSRLGGVLNSKQYIGAAPLVNPAGEKVGYIFALSNALALREYSASTLYTFIISAAAMFIISSILTVLLSARIVLPLRKISKAANRFGDGDYSARVPVQGDDELSHLAITFNNMASSFQTADQTRRTFMGNIAHELRTPMTTIKGFIDGMLDGTIPESQRDKYLAVVSQEVGRLARLTQNMLDISRLEAGEYVPKNKPFDIWALVASVFLAFERRVEDKKIEVQCLEADAPLFVYADEDFVQQILYNLVDNAIKFSPEGGSITVSATSGRNFVTLGVQNTGNTIPPDVLPYIFDRFYKADKSRGVNATGSGLGLHISKVLTNLMGGRIWAESKEHTTNFYFTLPAPPTKKKTNSIS